jgi:ATP-dependent 26S proteasome regulatory subunit
MLKELDTYLYGGFPLIMVNTIEVNRAVDAIIQEVNLFNQQVHELNTEDAYLKLHGLSIYIWQGYKGLTLYNEEDAIENTTDSADAFKYILTENTKPTVYIFKYPNLIWNDHYEASKLIWNTLEFVNRAKKQSNHQYLIFVGETQSAPVEIQREAVIINMPLPSKQIITSYINSIVDEFGFKFKHKEIERASNAAMGMTLCEVENAVRAAIVKGNGKNLNTDTIYNEKKQAVKRSGLLELIETVETEHTLGGMEPYKQWLNQVSKIYQNPDKAKTFGLKMPKGALLFGVSGGGKTLGAKVASNILGVPLYRCDIGRVYASLLGESEKNTRALFSLIDAVAPCVVLFDEIEKMFAGLGSSDMTDGGITSKVISSMLYYMEERTTPAFFIGTANSIFSLRPELLRKGRWDELWFIDLPNDLEREQILDIHLKKSGREFKNVIKNKFTVIDKLKNYTGAEIENIVHSALRDAFVENRDITEDDILININKTIPIAVTKKEEINQLRAWAANKARLANSVEVKLKEVIGVWGEEPTRILTKKKK